MAIKAPYNFVPVAEQVVFPAWGPFISQDIPFEDAQSGTINVTLTAHSPIFVRQGHPRPKKDEERPRQGNSAREFTFSKFDEHYFIPGSSIRGMIRNVLEIMTFSKMTGKVDDNRYALRDLSGPMKTRYLNHFNPQHVFGGWLTKNLETNAFSIIPCEKIGRVSHHDIDNKFSTKFCETFSNSEIFKGKKADTIKAARFKYDHFSEKEKSREVTVKYDHEDHGRLIYTLEEEGEKGELIFTGQPGVRKYEQGKWHGHYFEFVFIGRNDSIPVENNVIENFLFAYFEHDKQRWSIDWKYWREELFKGEEIPVFFLKDDQGEVTSIGLSYLFKLPYPNSVEDAIPQQHHSKKIDFADAIFGYVRGENETAGLKGRVHFSRADEKPGTVRIDQEFSGVLSSPKASYYPTYIRQEVANGVVKNFKTFMDKGAKVSGWKRFPIYGNQVARNEPPLANPDVITKFRPIGVNAQFVFKIRYHNLNKIELGALLSALTFHQTPDTFHSLGMAKPLGYGKVSLSPSLENETKPIEYFLKCFETYMELEGIFNWHKTDQIKELITMASPLGGTDSEPSPYMKLSEFVNAKKNKEALDVFSKIVKNEKVARSFLDSDLNANCLNKVWYKEIELKKKLRETIEETINELYKRRDEISSGNIKPTFFTGTLNPKKPPELDAIVVESGRPNKVQVYVRPGYMPVLPLNGYATPLEKGEVLIVRSMVTKKGDVVQVSFGRKK